jgi:hypothetical protein
MRRRFLGLAAGAVSFGVLAVIAAIAVPASFAADRSPYDVGLEPRRLGAVDLAGRCDCPRSLVGLRKSMVPGNPDGGLPKPLVVR